MLSRPFVLPSRFVVTTLLTAATGVLVASAMLAAAPRRADDSCAVAIDGLDVSTRALVARRTMACHDYEHGRITKAEYHQAIAALDTALAPQPIPMPLVVTTPPAVPPRVHMWATSVIGFSSQYSADAWSAHQALGAPDVYPEHGDVDHAWASQSADSKTEWLELGFATPRPVSAVEIYETFNPGAVESIQLITTSGRRIEVRPQGEDFADTGAAKLVVSTACTSEPIAAVRVNLASQNIEGWNEIDAVGLVPCAEQPQR